MRNLSRVVSALVVSMSCLFVVGSVLGASSVMGDDDKEKGGLKVKEPTQLEIAKMLEQNYRELDGYLQFDLWISLTEFAGTEKTERVVTGAVFMSKGGLRSLICKDDKLIRAFSLSPEDHKFQEWMPGGVIEEYESPLPQGTDAPRNSADSADFDCLDCMTASSMHSFVGVSEWRNLGEEKAKLNEGSYSDTDVAGRWRRIVEFGWRDFEKEKIAKEWGRDCYVFSSGLDQRINTIYINKRTILVERYDSDNQTQHRVRRYDNLRILKELPADFSWKINGDVKKAEAKDKVESEKAPHSAGRSTGPHLSGHELPVSVPTAK